MLYAFTLKIYLNTQSLRKYCSAGGVIFYDTPPDQLPHIASAFISKKNYNGLLKYV
jgi:hypothetical protein